MADRLGRRVLEKALGQLRFGQITLRDGADSFSSPQPSEWVGLEPCTVNVHDPRVYSAAAFGGGVALAESYMDGHWDANDLAMVVETLTVNRSAATSLDGVGARLAQVAERARYWLSRNTRAGSRRNIRAHYDLGNDLFELFLDPTMTYSSGIFENGAETLEESQIEKMDRACRKLELQPDDHLLEIGTGWGAMAMHAASRYGCRVTTTTISDEQFALATDRIRAAGLDDRIEVLKRDYRDLEGAYDKLVSIEMIEAVGAANVPVYLAKCAELLKPDGAMLLQAIVIRDQFFDAAARNVDFLKKYIFPGSCLLSNHAMMKAIKEKTDLRVWHAEDIGPHYATTLRMWRERFLGRLDEVRALGYDERFIRMWDYYLCYCEGVFRARHTGDMQLLLTKPLSRIGTASPAVGAPTRA